MQSGGLATRTENQKQISKTRHSTKSNLKRKYALLFRVHVSFASNKPLARFNETMHCREMQSGGLKTGTERRKKTSKTQYNTQSATKFEHECTPVCCIHVGFGCNQQLTRFAMIVKCLSAMQSGELATRTENQKQISKTMQHTISNKF